ncbi:MAG: SRPBCC family protein [Pseudonocardia sp.]|nr:SRPBCC family protein [Pseudonocardia sp.]
MRRPVAAPPERVWPLVSDIHLMAAWSEELQEIAWLDAAPAPRRDARVPGWQPAPAGRGVDHRLACRRLRRPRGHSAGTSRTLRTPPPFGASSSPRTRAARRCGSGPDRARAVDKEERIVAGRLREWQAGIESNLATIKELTEQAP